MPLLRRHVSILRRTAKRSLENEVTDLAASIAFYAFFGIFPLLLAVIAIAGHFLEDAEARTRVYDLLVETFPASAELLQAHLSDVVEARGRLGLAAVLGLLWSASAGFGAISRAINRAWNSPPRRSLFKAKLRYLLMALSVSTLLVIYAALTSMLELAELDVAWPSWFGLEGGAVETLHARIAGFLTVFLVFALLYKGAPTVEMRWRDVWPGALFATALTELGKHVFLAYVDHVAHLEEVFGSLSSIMVLLLWLYVAAIALFVGAEYNAVRAEARTVKATEPDEQAGTRPRDASVGPKT